MGVVERGQDRGPGEIQDLGVGSGQVVEPLRVVGHRELDETDRRIAAALVASPRASWRVVAECLGLSERTVVRRAVPLYADRTLRGTVVRNPAGARCGSDGTAYPVSSQQNSSGSDRARPPSGHDLGRHSRWR
ncbi:AsnC family protein [Nocardia sp. GAS34]|uniref:AsnC family protein n=1 Tax=Nocardia sp. GAS34 TaxID=3156305 RepID=UPI003D1F81B9